MKLKLSLFALFLSMVSWATVHNVSVLNNSFSPSSLSVNQGDTVIWTNNSGSHNVNGTTSTFPSNPASFGNSVGMNWTYQHVFNVAGSYSYQCDPHAGGGMTGSVTVNPAPANPDMIITGVYDGPLTGGTPKGIELYVINAISDLSMYGVSSANNGLGATGTPEYTFPSVSVAAGTFLYVATEVPNFTSFFGFAPDYTDGSMGINGDDAVELFQSGTVVDVFGDVNVDGSGTAWDYLDGWAYRINNTGPDGSTFVLNNWTYSGINTFDNTTTNAGASPAFPIGTYTRGTVNPPTGIPNYNISQVTNSDANGVADSLSVEMRLHGIVYSIDFDGNAGYSFYIYDNTGGINVFSSSDVSNYTSPAIGDSIRIIGEIAQFRGLTEIVPDSIVVLSSANNIKQPMVTYAMNESTEGDYVKLRGYWVMNPSQWPGAGSSASVDITNGTDTTVLRIDSDTDIDGSTVPGGPFNVSGAGSQFDFSSPYTEGYQILPSNLSDIESILPSTIPNYTIASVTTSDANGVADSLNVDMELRGVVYSIDFDGNAGYSLFMYDATGGINVYNFSNVNNYTNPQVGDSISVFGDIDQFNGLTEIFADSIVLWANNISLNPPAVVATLSEATEGEYIRLNGFSLVTPSQWPSAGSSASVDITDGTQTLTLRIDSDTDIDGTTAPTGSFDVVGAGSQFDSSNPYTSGYQILPSSNNDIILAPPANPTVNFAITSVVATEGVGSVQVNLLINPTSSVNDTITFQAIPGVNVTPTDGSVIPPFDPLTGMFKVPVPANADSAFFTINVVDDALVESNETLFISMANVTAGLTIGNNSSFQLVIQDNDAAAPGIPTYNIAQLTTNDANGIADSLNVYAKIHGVVYTDDFDGNNGYSFFVYDNTGGINVFNFADVGNYQVERGDSLRLIGEIDQFNGLTEFVIDSVVILDSNLTLKVPAVVTDLDETTEGEFIRLNGFTLVNPSQWPSAGSSANVSITDGTVTLTMRIDSDTDIDGTPAPTTSFDVVGAGGQFDSSNPYTSGYQIFPRDLNDIIPIIATSPTITFTSGSQTQMESAGTISMIMAVNPISANSEQIEVYVNQGAGITSADYTLAPAAVSDTMLITVPANASSVTFDVTIVDDAVQESNEDITFSIVGTTSGLSIGSPSVLTLTIQDNDTPIPYNTIASVTTNNAMGIPDSLNVYTKLSGVVFTDDFDGNAGLSFNIYDNTGGINVFNFVDVSNYMVTRGDSIMVIGEIDFYNGLTEILVDSIRVLKTNVALKAPQVVTTLDESTESDYIRINGYEVVDPSEWPVTVGGSKNVRLFKGNDTIVMRIDSDVNINGTPVPVGPFDVIGTGGQFDNSSPYDEGYQIFPRDLNDIIIFIPDLAITEVMPSSNQPNPIDGDWFEVTNYGNVPIDMNGFSWDDDSQTAGAHDITSSFVIAPGESVIFLDAVAPDDSSWLYTWQQASNGLRVINKTDFGGIGFSTLSSGGDEVNLYDQNGALIQKVSYNGSDVSAGFSIQYDTNGTMLGKSVSGVNGAYTSGSGDVGSPGNMTPIGLEDFILNNFAVYPNPASSLINISTENSDIKKIVISSVTGAKVASFNSNDSMLTIDVTDYIPGVYIISLEWNGNIIARKLIIE